MPSPLHETLVEMVRHRPDLAVELLHVLGLVLPEHDAARSESVISPTWHRPGTGRTTWSS